MKAARKIEEPHLNVVPSETPVPSPEPNVIVNMPKTKDFPQLQNGQYVQLTLDEGNARFKKMTGHIHILSSPNRPLRLRVMWVNDHTIQRYLERKNTGLPESIHHDYDMGCIVSIEILPQRTDYLCFHVSDGYCGVMVMGDKQARIGCQMVPIETAVRMKEISEMPKSKTFDKEASKKQEADDITYDAGDDEEEQEDDDY